MQSSDSSEEDHLESPGGLRDRFPGYFPPDDEEIKHFITQGLVAFDTNALLDVYRLNNRARKQYLAALQSLETRLWIPNRVGQEFLERRLSIIKECSTANEKLKEELKQRFEDISRNLREFGKRRGFSVNQMSSLEMMISKANGDIIGRACEYYKFGLSVDSSVKGDAILDSLERVLTDKVGAELDNLKAHRLEGERRIENTIPPGYSDRKKEPERAIGDYLIWRQLMNEAARRRLPVTLVTNDRKPDWVREDLGKKVGPRPELVAEMKLESGMPFFLINVQTFLLYSRRYLGVKVSDSTVQQARPTPKSPGELRFWELVEQEGPIVHYSRTRDSKTINVELASGRVFGLDATRITQETFQEIVEAMSDDEP
ncbi:PIN-like domain-containing protein [Actinomadura opuntiae]|uniref:PIN-like domain-containing protein n=1 Tax=Actinomadura sp. OS1-43 TaxID=604315 RepID=UPI00255B1FCD|nr:PIN-like domain-containing protein [Actinomadura sp. OS1-43]MDL4818931.1 PIN-like domain-containing protein [Actinomadura sp. OS1-43]